MSSVAEDAGAAQIAASFDLYNAAYREGGIDREELGRIFDPDARHETRFAALEGRAYDGYEGLERVVGDVEQRLGMEIELRDGRL